MAEKKVKKAAKPAKAKAVVKPDIKKPATKVVAKPVKAEAKKPAPTKKTAAKPAPAKFAKPVIASSQPRQESLGPVEELEHLFEHALQRPFFFPSWFPRLRFPDIMGEMSPVVDIFQDGNNVIVKAEVPGIRKEDIEVVLTDDTIAISGHKKSEDKVEKKDYYRVERSFGNFTRRLRLPAEVHTDQARASFKEGVLEIVIPKVKATQEKVKKIKVG